MCEIWPVTIREEHRLRMFENRVLGRIFGPKRDEVTGRWRKLHNEELHNKLLTKYYQGDQIKEDEVGGACSAHEGDENCFQNFGREARRKETTREAEV
jgi:hypothetical protein